MDSLVPVSNAHLISSLGYWLPLGCKEKWYLRDYLASLGKTAADCAELTKNPLAIQQCCDLCQKMVWGELGAKCIWAGAVLL